jgi:hypothetical protein
MDPRTQVLSAVLTKILVRDSARQWMALQAHPIKKAHEMAREKTMPTTLRMSDVTGGKLFYYV